MNIEAMAEKAGIGFPNKGTGMVVVSIDTLRHFAALAEEECAEECARVCDSQITEPGLSDNPAYVRFRPADTMAKKCAAAIRAHFGREVKPTEPAGG